MVKKALIAVVKQKMCFPVAGKGGRIPVKMEIRYDECYRTNFLGEDLKDDEFEDL